MCQGLSQWQKLLPLPALRVLVVILEQAHIVPLIRRQKVQRGAIDDELRG